jgi:fatty acid synthase
MFLQKARDAKRVYATVVHTKTNNDGFKEQGITYPSGYMHKVLLEQCYQERGIDITALEYFEAHGTGTKVCFIQSQNKCLSSCTLSVIIC